MRPMLRAVPFGAVLLVAVSLNVVRYAAAAQPEPQAESPSLALSPKLRGALIAEMAGLKDGIAEIVTALSIGDWGKAAARAERVRDAYIMKQKLSTEELHQLERALPAEFLELDERFHHHADAFAQAARRKDAELAAFYLSRMTEGCMNCHAKYATHSLKGFAAASPRPAGH